MKEKAIDFDATIWQVIADDENLALLLADESQMWLCAIAEGQILFQTSVAKWASLLFCYQQYIVVGYFPNPRIPQIRGIECFNRLSGQSLWKNDWASPIAFFRNAIEVLIEHSKLFLSLADGEICFHSPLPYSPKCSTPDLYTQDDKYFKEICSFVEQKIPCQIGGHIQYLQTTDFIIVLSDNGNLLITNTEGQVLLHKTKLIGNFWLCQKKLFIACQNKIIELSL